MGLGGGRQVFVKRRSGIQECLTGWPCTAAAGDSGGHAPGGARARDPHRGGVLGEMQEFDKSRELTKLAEGASRAHGEEAGPRLAREASKTAQEGCPAVEKQELSHPGKRVTDVSALHRLGCSTWNNI